MLGLAGDISPTHGIGMQFPFHWFQGFFKRSACLAASSRTALHPFLLLVSYVGGLSVNCACRRKTVLSECTEGAMQPAGHLSGTIQTYKSQRSRP